MAEPFLSEIRLMSFAFAPKGWAQCNGQLLPINQNQALFSLLGTTYGGDGRVNFALPDLRALTPMHTGSGFTLGQRGGETAHTLTAGEMATHTHTASASTAAASTAAPANNVLASGVNMYGGNPTVGLIPTTVTTVGGNQAHENMQPYLTINFCIALQGIFPSPN
jgi:microcystin-dependent protein